MGTDVCIYTANMNEWDLTSSQQTQCLDVDWLYFHDQGGDAPEPWQSQRVPALYDDPRLAAKWWRCNPPPGYSTAIWIDANTRITDGMFAEQAIACVRDGVALFNHPRRVSIADEADASLGYESQDGKYDDQPLLDQVAAYLAEGYPDGERLYATGTIVWEVARTAALREMWLRECTYWSTQDQISFPVVCWRLGIRPGTFPFRQVDRGMRHKFLGNRWMMIQPHVEELAASDKARKRFVL